MKSRRPHTYYCQNPECGNQTTTREILHGEYCPKCGTEWDDLPPDVQLGNPLDDEQGLAYFNRHIAGDR